MRKALLHIGAEKTGTTTIQGFLKQNRAVLRKLGFAYLFSPGDQNQTKLAAFAAADDLLDDTRGMLGVVDAASLAAFRKRFAADLGREIGALPPDIHTVIFSNEHLQSRLQSEDDVARLVGLLSPYFDAIRAIVYLRRQDETAVSLYSTYVRSGGTREDILPDVAADDPFYNLETMLARWAKVLGDRNVTARLFLRGELAGGSVVTDFLKVCGIPPDGRFRKVADENVSLSPLALEFARQFNEKVPSFVNGRPNRDRGPLDTRLEAAFPGRGRLPARAEAERFYALFRPANERLRQRWFPLRKTLFPEDFSGYPELREECRFGFSDAVEVAAALWRQSRREELRLEAEIALREARIALMENDPERAKQCCYRAIAHCPDSAMAFHRLCEVLELSGRIEEATKAAQRAVELAPQVDAYRQSLQKLTDAAA